MANDTSEAGVLSSLNEITQFWNISNDKVCTICLLDVFIIGIYSV